MFAATTLAQRFGFEHMEGGWSWGGAVFMGLMVVLFVALIVWFIITVAGRRGDTGAPSVMPTSSSRAKALLDERFAKGEMDRDDYLQRKADLEG